MTGTVRVAINGRYLTRPLTGVERFAQHMVEALESVATERGAVLDELRVLIPRHSRLTPPKGGARVERGGAGGGHRWEQLALPRLLRPGEWLYSPCNVGPALTRRQIVTIHDAQVYLTPETYSRAFRLWYRALLPLIGRRARLITTDSHYSRRMLERFGVVPAGKAEVVYGGADHVLRIAPTPGTLARYGLDSGGYLLAIGSLSPHKNVATLIEAMRRARPAMPLVIAGGGNPAVFRNAGMREEPGVRILGRVEDGDLRALYDGARALLFPSFYEGFGLPPLEAMMCGCPVAASDRSSIPEVCGDGALYAAPDDVDAWAAAINELATDDKLADELRGRGRRRAGEFTWRKSGERLWDLIAAAS